MKPTWWCFGILVMVDRSRDLETELGEPRLLELSVLGVAGLKLSADGDDDGRSDSTCSEKPSGSTEKEVGGSQSRSKPGFAGW